MTCCSTAAAAGWTSWRCSRPGRTGGLVTSIATCSFFEFEPSMGQPVRISLGRPRFRISWQLPSDRLEELTPRGWYFNAPPEEFGRRYLEQLDQVGPARLWEIFQGLSTGNDRLVMLCFERNVQSAADCHRRRFAAWWFEQTGEFVPELGGIHAAAQCCLTHTDAHVHGCILPGNHRDRCKTEEAR